MINRSLTKRFSKKFLSNSLVNNVASPNVFFQELFLISDNEKLLQKYVLKLHDEYSINICDVAIKSIDMQYNSFIIIDILVKTIGKISIKPDLIVVLFEKLNASTQNVLASGREYEIIEKIAIHNSPLANKILNELLSHDKPFIVNYISRILITKSKLLKKSIYNIIVSHLSNNSIYVNQAAIFALANLDYSDIKYQKNVSRTINLFIAQTSKNILSIDTAIIQSYANLIQFSEKAKEEILKYSLSDIPEIKFQISRILTLSSNYNSEQWFLDCLANIQKVEKSHPGIVHNLDVILSQIFTSGNTTYPTDYIINWSVINEYQTIENTDITKLFQTLFYHILGNIKIFNNLITRLLLTENSHAHLAFSDISHYLLLHNKLKKTNIEISLDKDIIETLSQNDILYITRKILSYIYDRTISSNLFLSICNASNYSNEHMNLIKDVFINFIAPDYLNSTIQFFNETDSDNPNIKEIIRDLLPILNKKQEEIKNIEILSEFEPSLKQKRLLYRAEQIRNNSYIMDAQKHSIMMQLAKKIPLKYGRGWFGFNDNNLAPPSPISALSHSFELPLSSITHPISKEMERGLFRLDRRENK